MHLDLFWNAFVTFINVFGEFLISPKCFHKINAPMNLFLTVKRSDWRPWCNAFSEQVISLAHGKDLKYSVKYSIL